MNKILILILSTFMIASCSIKETPDGIWEDNIHLSTKNVAFSSGEDSVSITTGGVWWWITALTFNDSTYNYDGREDLNLESESYSIKEEDFIVERRDKNTLFVKFNQNKTQYERVMIIYLEAGDYFDSVKIKQSSN